MASPENKGFFHKTAETAINIGQTADIAIATYAMIVGNVHLFILALGSFGAGIMGKRALNPTRT